LVVVFFDKLSDVAGVFYDSHTNLVFLFQ
jgi:hypothetical protein